MPGVILRVGFSGGCSCFSSHSVPILTGMWDTFGKPWGTVARVCVSCVLMVICLELQGQVQGPRIGLQKVLIIKKGASLGLVPMS